jgi:Leucine-rich repeat (LRR) protein
MNHNAHSYIQGGMDGLAEANNGSKFIFEDHQNDEIPSHLLPPNHPIHVRGPPKLTVAAFRTPSEEGEEIEGNDDKEKRRDIDLGARIQDEKKVQPEECPLDVPRCDDGGSSSSALTHKWYFRPGYLAIFFLATFIVVAVIVIPVILSSRSQVAVKAQVPTSAPTLSPGQTMSPEQIACNFITRTSLDDCRSTLKVMSPSIAAGVTIPSGIGLLTQLIHLEVDYSQLIGTIPPSLSNLSRLTYLSFFDNQLTGTIPPLAMLSQLTYLNLGYNILTGSVPSLATLSKLDSLSLGDNQLSGTIPPLSKLSQLTWLSLVVNQLTGSVPSLSNLSELTTLQLYGNQLTGTMPSFLCSLGISIYIDCDEITCDPNCCDCW